MSLESNENINIEDFANLTNREKEFCKEYILDWNATRAAIKAGYSKNSARQIGSENLSKLDIKKYIEYLKNNLAEVAGISPLMVINEHKKIAFSSIANLHLTWITRKEFEDLTDDQKACIQEIDTKIKVEYFYNAEKERKEPLSVEYVRIKLYDKTKSLDSINKMLGYESAKKIDISNPDGSLMPKSLPTVNIKIRDYETD